MGRRMRARTTRKVRRKTMRRSRKLKSRKNRSRKLTSRKHTMRRKTRWNAKGGRYNEGVYQGMEGQTQGGKPSEGIWCGRNPDETTQGRYVRDRGRRNKTKWACDNFYLPNDLDRSRADPRSSLKKGWYRNCNMYCTKDDRRNWNVPPTPPEGEPYICPDCLRLEEDGELEAPRDSDREKNRPKNADTEGIAAASRNVLASIDQTEIDNESRRLTPELEAQYKRQMKNDEKAATAKKKANEKKRKEDAAALWKLHRYGER